MTIELPETVPAGPVELIVLVPQHQEQTEARPQGAGVWRLSPLSWAGNRNRFGT